MGLGGLYATAVAQARDLAKYIGEQTAWHDRNEHFYFAPHYVDELGALALGMQGCMSCPATGNHGKRAGVHHRCGVHLRDVP
jgi:hypothetical protein